MAKRTRLPTPQTPCAAIYTRVSTRDQAELGVGLDAQLAKCRELAARLGLPVISESNDPGISGRDGVEQRPGLQAAIAATHSAPGAVLIVYSVSRLARRQSLLWSLLDDRGPYHLTIRSATEAFETATPTGRAMLGMIATFAALEADMISERTKDAMAELRAQGVKLGRPSVGKKAPELCRQVQELYAAGGFTHLTLAEHLNAIGLPTASGKGRWHSRTVRAALLADPED